METIEDLGLYTFPAMLANSLRKFADRPALAFASGTPITYAEVGKRIADARTMLFRLGVVKGDRVAILSASSPNWGISYFAIVSLGAIAVPLLPDFSAKEVETCLIHSGATTLIVSSKLAERVSPEARRGISRVVCIDDLSVLSGEEVFSGDVPQVFVDEDDTASIIYTSGTTGRSKGVELRDKYL